MPRALDALQDKRESENDVWNNATGYPDVCDSRHRSCDMIRRDGSSGGELRIMSMVSLEGSCLKEEGKSLV